MKGAAVVDQGRRLSHTVLKGGILAEILRGRDRLDEAGVVARSHGVVAVKLALGDGETFGRHLDITRRVEKVAGDLGRGGAVNGMENRGKRRDDMEDLHVGGARESVVLVIVGDEGKVELGSGESKFHTLYAHSSSHLPTTSCPQSPKSASFCEWGGAPSLLFVYAPHYFSSRSVCPNVRNFPPGLPSIHAKFGAPSTPWLHQASGSLSPADQHTVHVFSPKLLMSKAPRVCCLWLELVCSRGCQRNRVGVRSPLSTLEWYA